MAEGSGIEESIEDCKFLSQAFEILEHEHPREYGLAKEKRIKIAFRKMVADEVGSHEWDWKLFPDDETLDKSVERLKGRF